MYLDKSMQMKRNTAHRCLSWINRLLFPNLLNRLTIMNVEIKTKYECYQQNTTKLT